MKRSYMKSGRIYRQYQWIIKTLLERKSVTFDELNRKWVEDDVADGKPLQRSTFNRHRDDILDMLGIVIDCDRETYRYYIGNPEVLSDASVERWLYSTMTVHGMLADSVGMKERVVLENVPAGLQFLSIIIDAMRKNRRLRMGYKKFRAEGVCAEAFPPALVSAGIERRGPDAHLCPGPHDVALDDGGAVHDARELLGAAVFRRVLWGAD